MSIDNDSIDHYVGIMRDAKMKQYHRNGIKLWRQYRSQRYIRQIDAKAIDELEKFQKQSTQIDVIRQKGIDVSLLY
ncbi:MAG: hypothetical protein N3A66_09930, partial [Planctomycetota bacterium]|nr:hypothetical protein [Planctomycetota bacterium]